VYLTTVVVPASSILDDESEQAIVLPAPMKSASATAGVAASSSRRRAIQSSPLSSQASLNTVDEREAKRALATLHAGDGWVTGADRREGDLRTFEAANARRYGGRFGGHDSPASDDVDPQAEGSSDESDDASPKEAPSTSRKARSSSSSASAAHGKSKSRETSTSASFPPSQAASQAMARRPGLGNIGAMVESMSGDEEEFGQGPEIEDDGMQDW
jgi:hypothetical protein